MYLIYMYVLYRDTYEKVQADLRIKKEELATLQNTQPSRVSPASLRGRHETIRSL